ncbi:MAG TPA: hypothetical protein VIT22_05150 [Pseudoxanthomonas sp.]
MTGVWWGEGETDINRKHFMPDPPRLSHWLIQLLVLAIAFASACWLLRDVQGLPEYDYWYMLPTWLGESGLQLSYGGLYERSNDHIVAIPKLFYALNYLLTSGDNRGLLTLVLLFSLSIGMVLTWALSIGNISPIHSVLLGVAASVAVFPPFAAHNFLFPMSGVAWISANFFVIAAAFAMFHAMRNGSVRLLAFALFFGALASQSYSTGALAILALSAQALVSPEKRYRLWGVLLLLAGLAVAGYIGFAHSDPDRSRFHVFRALPVIKFTVGFIGGGLTRDLALARILGALGLIHLLIMLLLTFTSKRRLVQAFWIGLACYAIGSGLIGGAGRLIMSPDVALSSRYATLPSLFWLSLLGLTLACLFGRDARDQGHGRVRWPMVGVHAIVAIATLATFLVLWQGADKSSIQAFAGVKATKNKASLAVYLDATDVSATWPLTTLSPVSVPDVRNILAGAGHVPFDDTFSACPRVGAQLTVASSSGAVTGHFDVLQKGKDGASAKAAGWATGREDRLPILSPTSPGERPFDCVVLADEAGKVRGLALGGIPRMDVAKALGDSADPNSGWSGYVALPGGYGKTVLAAYGRKHGDEAWSRLANRFIIAGDRIEKAD